MPDLTSLAPTFRRGGFSYTGYLAHIPRTVVLTGTITAVPSYPALQVSYTLNTGSTGNVKQDMTVDFFSSTGVLKATLRVASGQSITSVVLPVNEFAAGSYNVVIGDTFKVYEEYRIKDRLVSATAALNKDSRIVLSDQNANPPPVCNSGGPNPGFTTTRSFAGGTSFSIDPDSAGTITHVWDYIDGSGTTNVANPTGVTFPVGFRMVKHTATDASNSKSTVQYVPTWVFNKTTYRPLRVQVNSLNEQLATGRLSFKLPYGSEGDIANLPDGSPIVYFETEKRGGVEGSYGSNVTDRSHVKFSGYLVRDSISIDADQNEVTFEAVGTMAILAQIPALPQLMVSTASPTKWSEVRGLTTKEILWYLSYWGSTLQTAWDFVWTDGFNLSYPRIAVEGQSIADQLNDIANSISVQVTCDALGRIQFIRDPNYLTEIQRAARTTAYDFTTADLIKVELTREHQGTVKFVRGEGITSSSAPVFSNAPGNAPSSIGTGSDTLAKQIVASQAQLNVRTGYHFAKLNSLYDGRFVPKGVRLTVPDGYDILSCADREFVTLTLPASTNTRGISFTSTERWTVESKDITYDVELGTKEIIYTIDHETSGVPGVTYIPPQESDSGTPDIPPIDLPFPDTGTDPGTGTGVDPVPPTGPISPSTANMASFCTDNNAYYTADFDTPEASGGPDWTTTAAIDLTGLSGWGSGTLISFEADLYSPAYLGTGDEVNGVFVTDEVVQRIEDIFGTPTLGTAFTLADTTTARTLMMDRAVEGFGIVASWVLGDGVYAAVTLDGGDTWAENLVTAFENTAAGGIAPGVFISPHTDGKALIGAWTATGDNTDAEASLYRTLNYGSSWSHLTAPDIDSGVDVSSFIGVAFDNAPANVIYHRRKDETGLHLIRNSNGTETDITPDFDGVQFVPIGQRLHEIAIPDDDPNTLAMIGVVGNAPGSGLYELFDTYGTIIDSGDNYITVEATFDPLRIGGYAAGISAVDNGTCRTLQSGTVLSGSVSNFLTYYAECGETPDPNSFNHSTIGGTGCWSMIAKVSTVPFTIRFEIGLNECVDSGTLIYALLKTENARAEEPTWTIVDSGEPDVFPYRQVFSIGSGKYLLIGEDGSIAIANDDGVNSRIGDLVTTGDIVGTVGI